MRAAASLLFRNMSSSANPSPYRQLKSPLRSIRVLELAGLAPAPFAGMVLSDFGADVIRIDRPGGSGPPDLLCRGKRSCAIDIKNADGAKLLLKLIQNSDVVLDPYRPGVLERLGLGPMVMHAHNKRLGTAFASICLAVCKLLSPCTCSCRQLTPSLPFNTLQL
jgi:crotonobetainyl-CoA:carnitine CoA-transferase CaiB-like acyl-CoA transferase